PGRGPRFFILAGGGQKNTRPIRRVSCEFVFYRIGAARMSVVAIDALPPLVPLLRLDRECRDRTRLKPSQRNRLPRFFTIPVRAVINPRQGLVDFGNELALAIARSQFDGAIRFRRRAVGQIGMILVFFLKVQQRFLGLLEDVFPPGEQLDAKILALPLVHERLFVRRPIIFGLSQHFPPTPCFFCSWGHTVPPYARQAYIRPSTGG